MAEIEYRDYSKARLSKEEFREILKKSVVVREVDIDDLVFLEKNANVMEGEVLRRLVENIEHDGILTQLPFVQRLPNGKYEIISGNHRVKASIEAGLKKVMCIVCEVTLPEDEKLRIQISHNSIRGQQNGLVLRELLSEIVEIDALRLSGADFETSTIDLKQVDFKSIDASALDIRTVVLYFTNPDIREMDRLLSEIDDHLNGSSRVYLARYKAFKAFIDEITKVKREANIINSATALSLIIEYAREHIDDILDYYKEKYGKEEGKEEGK